MLAGLEQPLGLATGATMEPVYAALTQQVARLSVADRARLCRQWRSFNLDEYVGLGPGDPPSFAATMERLLIRPLGLDPASVALPDGLVADPIREPRHRRDHQIQTGANHQGRSRRRTPPEARSAGCTRAAVTRDGRRVVRVVPR